MKKLFPVLFIVVLIGLVGIAVYFLVAKGSLTSEKAPVSSGKAVRVGFSLGALREERWQKDIDLFTKRAKELGAEVVVEYASEDANLQETQAENLIIQGVGALVVVAHDGDKAAAIVEKAHAAGIKVIAYDRMINKSDVDLYLTFDSRKIGQQAAEVAVKTVPKGKYAYIGGATTDSNSALLKEGTMKVLTPYIQRGDITLVVDQFTPDWRPEEAYKTIKTYLTKTKALDAVIAGNDGTAGGVIQALKEFGLEGKVPVTGSDADLIACQRVVEGTQLSTEYTPLEKLAYQAAESAVAFAAGEKAQTNGVLNNGTVDVPSFFLDPILVTKENMRETVIKGGFHTEAEVYKTVPAKK